MFIDILLISLSGIFVISAISKILNLQVFEKSIFNFRLSSRYVKHIAICIIIMEITAGIFIISGFFVIIGLIIVFSLLVSFSVLIINSLMRGDSFPCSCFGETSSNPISWYHIVRNSALLLVTLYLFGHLSIQDYSSNKQVVLFLSVTLIAFVWFGYQFIYKRFKSKQPDDTNKSIANDSASQEILSAKLQMSGGSVFSIESFLTNGKPIVFVFLDFQFLPCQRLLASSIERLNNLKKTCTILLVVKNQSDDHVNRIAKALNIEVVVQNEYEIAASFNLRGVPALAVLDLTGAVNQRVVGEKAINTVLSDPDFPIAQPEKASSFSNPVKRLPNLSFDEISMVNQHGHYVNLKYPGNRDSLLVFWSPYCSACSGLLEELERQKTHLGNSLRIILITSINKGLNNYNFDDIVIDQNFKIGKQLSITGTPSAIFIGKNYLNESQIYSASGKDSIFDLMHLINSYNIYPSNTESRIYEPVH